MNKYRIVYYLLPFSVGIVALILFVLFKGGSPVSQEENANLCYVVSLVTSLVVILGAWLPLHFSKWSPLLRLCIIETAADVVLFDYFVFGDSNLIYAIALLAVVYIWLWPRKQNDLE